MQTKEYYEEKESFGLRFLYHTIFGRIFLKLLTRRFVSQIVGVLLNSRLSRIAIKPFIKKNEINMDDYPKTKYQSFNDFFTRKIAKNKRFISPLKTDFISVADSKLSVYKIGVNNKLKIKNSYYTIQELIKDEELAKEYSGGWCFVFRLGVTDYHHYIFNDDGSLISNHKINGILHTVQPLAFKKYKVFSENNREYSILKTHNFGNIIQIEVGALNVGKIKNMNITKFKRGMEKGYFEFGGSTIIVLVKKNILKVDRLLLKNSKEDIETIVKLGDKIASKMD